MKLTSHSARNVTILALPVLEEMQRINVLGVYCCIKEYSTLALLSVIVCKGILMIKSL